MCPCIILKLISIEDAKLIKLRIEQLCKQINLEALSTFITNIDIDMPNEYSASILPNYKKELIVKLIALRASRLQEIINERIS